MVRLFKGKCFSYFLKGRLNLDSSAYLQSFQLKIADLNSLISFRQNRRLSLSIRTFVNREKIRSSEEKENFFFTVCVNAGALSTWFQNVIFCRSNWLKPKGHNLKHSFIKYVLNDPFCAPFPIWKSFVLWKWRARSKRWHWILFQSDAIHSPFQFWDRRVRSPSMYLCCLTVYTLCSSLRIKRVQNWNNFLSSLERMTNIKRNEWINKNEWNIIWNA